MVKLELQHDIHYHIAFVLVLQQTKAPFNLEQEENFPLCSMSIKQIHTHAYSIFSLPAKHTCFFPDKQEKYT